MNNKLLKTIIITITCLIFGNCAYAEIEEEMIVVTNVAYTASVTKAASTETVTMDPITGSQSGLSTVFTLRTNGGDEYFDYIITSYIDVDGDRIPAYGDDGRLLFAHETIPPTTAAVNNALTGSGQSKNIFAYPSRTDCTGGIRSEFRTNYKEYGNCHVIFMGQAVGTDVTHRVLSSACANTYEPGVDEAGNYKATIQFTIVSK